MNNREVGYLYCKPIEEEEIKKYLKIKRPAYEIKNLSEYYYDKFRDDLEAVNKCLVNDLVYLIGADDNSLLSRIKKEIQIETLEAIRLNSIGVLAEMIVNYLDMQCQGI